MTKSVLIYTPSLNFGGAEKALVTLANCLIDVGYKVTYCFSEEGELAEELQPEISQVNLVKPRMLSSVLPLYKTVTKLKPNVIITTLVHCNIMLLMLGIIYNLFHRNKIKVIVRETTNISFRLEQMGLLKRLFYKFLMSKTYTRANAVVFPNKIFRN